jgi:hypothetical protein
MPSTVIDLIQYDETTHRLAVGFSESGRTYVFSDVPYGTFEAFLNARSKGGFFNRHIKDHYSFELLEGV